MMAPKTLRFLAKAEQLHLFGPQNVVNVDAHVRVDPKAGPVLVAQHERHVGTGHAGGIDWERVRGAFQRMKNAHLHYSATFASWWDSNGKRHVRSSHVEHERRRAALEEARRNYIAAFPNVNYAAGFTKSTIHRETGMEFDWESWPINGDIGVADELAAVERMIERWHAKPSPTPMDKGWNLPEAT